MSRFRFLSIIASVLLVLAPPVLAQKQILEDRPVTGKTLLDRIQIQDFSRRYISSDSGLPDKFDATWQPREHR